MIIGFAGKAATGKTTAAKYLLKHCEAKVVILPMAQMLREEVETFIRLVGAADQVPLIYGGQDDKICIFYLDESRALEQCSKWGDFVSKNQDIQEFPGQSAVTVRRILQWWGTEYRRTQDHAYWTKAWERKLREYDLETVHILVDDVRFVNELKTINNHGGIFIRIERPGFDGANSHCSENSLDDYSDWNLTINNDCSLEEFVQEVEKKVLPLLSMKR